MNIHKYLKELQQDFEARDDFDGYDKLLRSLSILAAKENADGNLCSQQVYELFKPASRRSYLRPEAIVAALRHVLLNLPGEAIRARVHRYVRDNRNMPNLDMLVERNFS